MTSLGKEVRPMQPVYALILLGLILLFLGLVVERHRNLCGKVD